MDTNGAREGVFESVVLSDPGTVEPPAGGQGSKPSTCEELAAGSAAPHKKKGLA
jgi:hypothetical protein